MDFVLLPTLFRNSDGLLFTPAILEFLDTNMALRSGGGDEASLPFMTMNGSELCLEGAGFFNAFHLLEAFLLTYTPNMTLPIRMERYFKPPRGLLFGLERVLQIPPHGLTFGV